MSRREALDLCLGLLRSLGVRPNLRSADLCYAYLGGADLSNADLRNAYLRGTCLDPSAELPPIADAVITAAGLEIVGDRVRGWRTERSKYVGNTHYLPREEPYTAPVFSVCTATECHPGLYLAGREWLATKCSSARLVRVECLRSELVRAGDKWRAKRLWVLEQQQRAAE